MCEISWYSAGPITILSGRITAGEYLDISGNQVHLMVQMSSPKHYAVFKMTVRPHKQSEVFSLGLRTTKMHFNIFPGQHNRQT
jgi:hypothetical protein